MRAAFVLVMLALLCSCASSVPPPPGSPVRFTVVDTQGLPANGLAVIADSSVEGLIGLTTGFSKRNQLLCTYPTEDCWSSARFPAGSAAFALVVYQGCRASDLIGAYLSGSSLNFAVDVRQNTCAPGAGAIAEPWFDLVAISISDLPSALIRVHVYYAGAESPESTLVDLRTPLTSPPSISTRQAEVQQAIVAASGGSAGGVVTEVAARRFTTGPITCASPQPADSQPGYVIGFGGADGEFDYAGGEAVHCPATTG